MEYRRYYQPGGWYFFTVVTWNRRPILTHTEHLERLRAAFRRVRASRPFSIDAIVVLPDHLHTIWRLPPNDADFSSRWSSIKRYFSVGVNTQATQTSRLRRREKPIWQRRFWEHVLRDHEDWRRHMDYIHYNPVKHGYVDHPRAWPHSSFAQAVQKGLYPPDWGRQEPENLRGMNPE